MATVFQSLSFVPLSSCKLFVSQYQPWNPLQYPPPKYFSFTINAASHNKSSRSKRKVKSNEELYNDIREFLSSVGLPKSHVPTMKELSAHGRNDLAHIVRRRGYKYISQLLESSTKTDFDGLAAEKSLAGQDEKVKNEVEDVSLSVEVPSIRDSFGSTNTDCSSLNSDDHNCMGIESTANSLLQETESYTLNSLNEKTNNIVEGISLFTDISVMKSPSDGSCTSADLNSDNIVQPTESSANSYLEEKVSPNINCQHEKGSNITETISSSVDSSTMENYSSSSNFNSSLNFEHGYTYVESSASKSLEEKVAKFIQSGDLDMIEDNVYDTLNGIYAKESEGFVDVEDAIEVKPRTGGAENAHICNDSIDGATSLNGSALTKQIAPSATVNHPLRDDHLAAEGQRCVDFDSNLNVEASRRENQVKVNHLKFMLHQKEMELSRLKEQIEKETFALSLLQTNAETEINKAEKLISEKDAELLAAEESLSGLEEVEIQYSGDGEIVEVAGSFNGWHHRIKMDPQLSSSIIEPVGSRKSRRWSTVLWLYPGIYQIKFIVDGQWKIDPQRESVTACGFCNNILRVNQ